MVKKLCEAYLEQYEYLEKIRYLSKYDERLVKVWLDGWIELVRIKYKLMVAINESVSNYEQD